MNQTTNYKLDLPEGRDIVDIDVLNGNFLSLDALIKAASDRMDSSDATMDSRQPVIGIYTGDGSESRTIILGFRPSLILLCGETGFSQAFSGMASSSFSIHSGTGNPTQLAVSSSGFQVYCDTTPKTNANNFRYLYVAWR